VADLTPRELLEQIVEVCEKSATVQAYSVRTLTPDVLSVRVFLIGESFVDVFHNAATAKTAYAWIRETTRVYGKDNAKMGWHVHPFDAPDAHSPCEPLSFGEFLSEVERLQTSSPTR